LMDFLLLLFSVSDAMFLYNLKLWVLCSTLKILPVICLDFLCLQVSVLTGLAGVNEVNSSHPLHSGVPCQCAQFNNCKLQKVHLQYDIKLAFLF
jgi:hypothetical protein